MTDNEIIKALEEAISKMEENCIKGFELRITGKAVKGILDLINRLKSEIERYKRIIKILENDIKTAKSEAIKEFAERLKCGVPQETGVIRCADVDNLVKEMVGDM